MFRRVIILLVCASLTTLNTGCFGSFELFKKIYNWNDSLDNKWVRTGILWLFNIIPVYPVSAFVDAIVFNLIEFWAGNNPLALDSDTETTKTFTSRNKIYDVTFGNGSIIILETKGPNAGKSIILSLDKKTNSWYLSDGKTSTLVACYNPKPLGTIDFYYPDGKVLSRNINTAEKIAVKQTDRRSHFNITEQIW
ncbi:MAG TPA: DUF3332 domain-containing protein [Chitinispirillaceae bacterium]|nr:DUF3332 domain-containing protein [Chitinispirillaceae bacterium]